MTENQKNTIIKIRKNSLELISLKKDFNERKFKDLFAECVVIFSKTIKNGSTLLDGLMLPHI